MPNPKQVMSAMQAISKAAESAGQKAPVTANKSLTTTQDFHTSMGDSMRQRAARDKELMDSFNYKYDKGQRVFTEDSAQRNHPPMTVLSRTLEGNRMMREDPNDILSKKIIDELTGKPKRTPHEAGYRVRLEHSPENWSEFSIPESAIKGAVDKAKGGLARMAGGGQPSKVLSGNIMAGASWNSINPTLADRLTEATGMPTYNAAVGATTSADTYKQLIDFIEAGGSFEEGANVFLQAGGADFLKGVSRRDTEENLDKILTELEKQGVNVVLTGSPNASSYEQVISNNFDPESDPIYKNLVAKHSNVVLVDSMGEILQDKSLLDDPIHPNAEGWEVYNDSVLGALNQLKQREEQVVQKEEPVDIPQEIEKITQTSTPEITYTPTTEVEETVDIPEEIERITNNSQEQYTPDVQVDEYVSEDIPQINTEVPEEQNDYQAEQTYMPPSVVQETPSIPYERQEIASISERQPEAVETRSGPDYSRAYGALGGQEVVNNLYNQFLEMGLDENTIESVFSKYYSPETQEVKKGGAIRMQVGGLSALAKLGTAGTKLTKAEMASLRARGMGVPSVDFADPLAPASMRMSEALGNAGAEGKTLNFTEADRSRVFGKNRGGVGFAGLQQYSEPHKKANTVWGFGNTATAEKKIKQNDPENTMWTTFVGSPTQHRSNSVVIGDAIKEFQNSVKKGVVPREQIMLMNKRLNELTDKKTGERVFENGFDLTDPSALDVANTFSRRAAVGDVMLGLGVKGPMSRLDFKKEFPDTKFTDGSDIGNILKRETDPDLVDAGTYDVGNRLFVMDGKIIQRSDLNEAFPEQVTGYDLGMKYQLVPPDKAMRNFYKAREGRLDKNDKPSPVSYYDLSRAKPSQKVDEDYLTFLQNEGYKDGGSAEPKPFHDFDQIMKRKDGGTVSTFEQRLKSAIDQHMAVGGTVERHYAEAGSVPAPTPQELEKMSDAQGAAFGVFPQMASKRFQQPSPTMDKASEMLKAQVTKEWEQAGQPGGAKGLAFRISAVLAGGVPDFVNFGQSMIPALNEEKPSFTSVLDSGKPRAPYRDTREMQKGLKYPMSGTSADIKNSMREKGMINEDEYPLAEILGGFAAPYALAKAPRAIEGGLNSVTAAARRPFTPATLTTEAVSPDLAKFKNSAFQDYATSQMIGEGSAVPMTTMGGRKTSQIRGQGVYLNDAGELERNPMVGVNIPRAGNLATNKGLRADIATAGQELGQEAMAAHRFVPMATNQIKDASAMMIRGQGGRPLTNKEVMAMANELPGMIVTHSPANGGLMIAPYSMTKGQIPQEFLSAQAVARKVLGKDAKVQFGKADEKKDLMYMMRNQYAEEGGRGTSQGAQDIRNKLKRMDQNFPLARQ